MDYRNVPDVPDDQRKRNEAEMSRLLDEHDHAVEERINNLRKAGYSDHEIENLFGF